MDADALALLIILKGELKAISNSLQPQPEIIEDIFTDNGLNDNNKNNDVNNLSVNPQQNNEHDQKEDEKAPELKTQITKHEQQQNINYNELGFRIDDLINNYLTPTIKQLNKKRKKNNKKKKSDININRYYSPYKELTDYNTNDKLSEPGQVYLKNGIIDDMSNYSEKIGTCCRKFITSLFCGCGMFQMIGIFIVFIIFGFIFVFYNASEITLILKELNHWKELSVKRVEYELTNSERMAQINFDMDVDIDKLKQEHKHREYMEIIKTKESLTKEFIDKNTRTVTTTYWNFLTTETETVSQTIFSEEDIAFFQNNILYYGFNNDKAIESPTNNNKQIDNDNANMNDNNEQTVPITEPQCIPSDTQLCSTTDDFDSI